MIISGEPQSIFLKNGFAYRQSYDPKYLDIQPNRCKWRLDDFLREGGKVSFYSSSYFLHFVENENAQSPSRKWKGGSWELQQISWGRRRPSADTDTPARENVKKKNRKVKERTAGITTWKNDQGIFFERFSNCVLHFSEKEAVVRQQVLEFKGKWNVRSVSIEHLECFANPSNFRKSLAHCEIQQRCVNTADISQKLLRMILFVSRLSVQLLVFLKKNMYDEWWMCWRGTYGFCKLKLSPRSRRPAQDGPPEGQN